ncbi:MAG: preprotein translocase subunit SecE [Alphaproteobacteria bacterium]
MKNPATFLKEVRQEVSKVTPPTRREVIVTSIMVLIMATIAALFFFAFDLLFAQGIQFVLGLGN